MRSDGDPDEPQRHRPRKQERADVVSASYEEHRAEEAFEGLPEWDAGRE